MSITTDIQKIKDHVSTKCSGQGQIAIVRRQIKALDLYLERRLKPGLQASIRAISNGANLSAESDDKVIAIRTEIANLYALLETEILPLTGLDF